MAFGLERQIGICEVRLVKVFHSSVNQQTGSFSCARFCTSDWEYK